MTNLFIGVIGSIIAWILIELFSKLIIPYFQGLFNETPNIAGRWNGIETDINGNEIHKSRLEVKQIGTRITAQVYRSSNNGERVFDYKGLFLSGQVVLNFVEPKGRGRNIGAMVLHLSGDLNNLIGKSTYYHHDIGNVISDDKLYRRINQ